MIVPLVGQITNVVENVLKEQDMKLVWCRYDDYGFALHHGRGIYELKLKDKIIIIEWLGADFRYEKGRRIITGPELEELISDLCNDQNAQALWINASLDKVVIARVKEEE